MKLAVVVMVAIIVNVGASDGSTDSSEETPRIYCGRHLAYARYVHCNGVTEDRRKRSIFYNSPLMMALLDSQKAAQERVVLHSFQNSRELTSPVKRIGIADDCCLKPCYTSELLNYC